MFAFAAIHRPIVVAMVVNGTLAIEEQTILACLQRQSSIRAEEELIAVLRVSVRLDAVLFGALGSRQGSGCK